VQDRGGHREKGGEPITDTDAVALICGLVWTNIAALIEVGISPTPAPSTPPSVLLLRALARLPHDGESIADMLTLATSIGVRPTELILLLRRGLDAGYLRDRPRGCLRRGRIKGTGAPSRS